MLLHVCTSSEWNKFVRSGFYQPEAYARDGFIHCCLERQLPGVLQRYFYGQTDLLLLRIDESKLVAKVKFEKGPDGDDFPHIYGPVNKEAITAVTELEAP
jgi:uncharacterized protein (DUF952 family)